MTLHQKFIDINPSLKLIAKSLIILTIFIATSAFSISNYAASKLTTMRDPGKPKTSKQLTIEDGKHIYERYCAACHNGNYQGAPVLGDKSAWQPIIKQGMDVLIKRTIKGFKNMPARGSCSTCTNAELKAAVIYMVEKSKADGDYKLWLKK